MTEKEKRLAEIYSYYLADCYEDDFGGTFAEWQVDNMYGKELSKLAEQALVDALELDKDDRRKEYHEFNDGEIEVTFEPGI